MIFHHLGFLEIYTIFMKGGEGSLHSNEPYLMTEAEVEVGGAFCSTGRKLMGGPD